MAWRGWGHELRAQVPPRGANEPSCRVRETVAVRALEAIAGAIERLLGPIPPAPLLAPALAGGTLVPAAGLRADGAPVPFAPVRVAFARESAFDIQDPHDFEGGLSAAELGEALDGVDFFGVLSSGALGEDEPFVVDAPQEPDGDAAGGLEDGELELSLEDASMVERIADEGPSGPPAPIVCEATRLPAIDGTPMESFRVRGRRHVAVVVERPGAADAFVRVLAGLAPVARGELWLFGHPVHALSADERAETRALVIGAITDAVPLIASLTIDDNLLLAAAGAGLDTDAAAERVGALAGRFDLDAHRRRHPQELSAEVRWRARAARALIHRPAILVADVTTPELDAAARAAVLSALGGALEETTSTVVLVCPEASVPDWITTRVPASAGGRETSSARAGEV